MKQVFRTDDGAIFESEDAAKHHESKLDLLKPAEEYRLALYEAGWRGTALSRQVNAAANFLRWELGEGSVPKTPKKKEVAEKPAD